MGGKDGKAKFAAKGSAKGGVVHPEGFGRPREMEGKASEWRECRRERRSQLRRGRLYQGREDVLCGGVVNQLAVGCVVKSVWFSEEGWSQFVGVQGDAAAKGLEPRAFAVSPVGECVSVHGWDGVLSGGSKAD